jgi:hypothetical protein
MLRAGLNRLYQIPNLHSQPVGDFSGLCDRGMLIEIVTPLAL